MFFLRHELEIVIGNVGLIVLGFSAFVLTFYSQRLLYFLVLFMFPIAFLQIVLNGIDKSQLMLYCSTPNIESMEHDIKVQLEASITVPGTADGRNSSYVWYTTEQCKTKPCVAVNGYDDFIKTQTLIPDRFLCDCKHKTTQVFDDKLLAYVNLTKPVCTTRVTDTPCRPKYIREQGIYVDDRKGCWENIMHEFNERYLMIENIKCNVMIILSSLQIVMLIISICLTTVFKI